MEIPPDSSIAQSSAYFTGFSKDEINKRVISQYPIPSHNFLTASSDRTVASSYTGELRDFKYEDYQYAHQMFNGIQQYPFQNIAQISNYKFDPFYIDGSENEPNFNVNENLIGTPLGTSLLEDPRLNFVKNMLTLKEYQGQANQLNDAYIKELYMINAEKGSNYYQNMLEKQKVAIDQWSRKGRNLKQNPIDPVVFTINLPQGSARHLQSKKRRMTQTLYSTTPSVQRDYRRERMERAATSDPTDLVNFKTIVNKGRGGSSSGSANTIVSNESGFFTAGSASLIHGNSVINRSDRNDDIIDINDMDSVRYASSVDESIFAEGDRRLTHSGGLMNFSFPDQSMTSDRRETYLPPSSGNSSISDGSAIIAQNRITPSPGTSFQSERQSYNQITEEKYPSRSNSIIYQGEDTFTGGITEMSQEMGLNELLPYRTSYMTTNTSRVSEASTDGNELAALINDNFGNMAYSKKARRTTFESARTSIPETPSPSPTAIKQPRNRNLQRDSLDQFVDLTSRGNLGRSSFGMSAHREAADDATASGSSSGSSIETASFGMHDKSRLNKLTKAVLKGQKDLIKESIRTRQSPAQTLDSDPILTYANSGIRSRMMEQRPYRRIADALDQLYSPTEAATYDSVAELRRSAVFDALKVASRAKTKKH